MVFSEKPPLLRKMDSRKQPLHIYTMIYHPRKEEAPTPKRKISFLTPQETRSSYRSQQNLIIIDSPPISLKHQMKPFPQNTCFKCQSSQHAIIHCPSYKCWWCNQTSLGHYQHKCPEHPKNQPHVLEDRDYYNDYISADAEYEYVTLPHLFRNFRNFRNPTRISGIR